MVFRLLRGALRIDRFRLALVVLSTAMGAGIAASLGAVSLEIGDRLAAELRTFGANIVLDPAAVATTPGATPAEAFLADRDLSRLLTVFWRHNVVGVAPFLTAPANLEIAGRRQRTLLAGVWFERTIQRPGGEGELRGGLVPIFPFLQLEGRWPVAPRGETVLGRAVASRLGAGIGDLVSIDAAAGTRQLRVTGIVSSGGAEEEQALVQLEDAQEMLARPGAISRALVSAITVPLDDFGRRDPTQMTTVEAEKWFCTPYVTSVAKQLESAIPGSRARPVWTMAEGEARVLSRLHTLMLVLAVVAIVAAALAVASTFAARVLGRRSEIALMRACGADGSHIALLLGTEALVAGTAGGAFGTVLAAIAVRALGVAVFGTALPVHASLVPLALGGALVVAALGAVGPIRRAMSIDPTAELQEAT